jgi:hypothetical protein
MRDLQGIAEINGPRRAELQAERIANAERARIHNLDWRARVAERQRNLRRVDEYKIPASRSDAPAATAGPAFPCITCICFRGAVSGLQWY